MSEQERARSYKESKVDEYNEPKQLEPQITPEEEVELMLLKHEILGDI